MSKAKNPETTLDLQNRVCREMGLPCVLWTLVQGKNYIEMRRSACDIGRRHQIEQRKIVATRAPTG